MNIYTGAAFALPVRNSVFDIFVTGRDHQNRSNIGRARIDILNPCHIIEMSDEAVFSPGTPGAFDENGVSYPWFVATGGNLMMYYVGWMKSETVPYKVNVGLAAQKDKDSFIRYSESPVLTKNDEDYHGTGSVCVLKENDQWKMWYTSFVSWEKCKNKLRYRYFIKYAESDDGIAWRRNNNICINFKDDEEIAICRPSVLKINEQYYMWYCYRGEYYKLGYAVSDNGIHWRRKDDEMTLSASGLPWDSESQAYPHVFKFDEYLYLLYCGNEYGKNGLGLARMPLI